MFSNILPSHNQVSNDNGPFVEYSDTQSSTTPKIRQNSSPDMRQQTDNYKVLIIGCGVYDKFTGCTSSHQHADKNEITIDIVPQVQPDIVADITEPNIKDNVNYQAIAGDSRFSRICFEMVPNTLFDTSNKRNAIADNLETISNKHCKISIGTGSIVGNDLSSFGTCLRRRGFGDIKIYNPKPELAILHAKRKSVNK